MNDVIHDDETYGLILNIAVITYFSKLSEYPYDMYFKMDMK
jgi:hypothetical protein